MRFWDTSAVAAHLIEVGASSQMAQLLSMDPSVVVWWGTRVECHSAIARQRRTGELDTNAGDRSRALLTALADAWKEIAPSELVREHAGRLLYLHDLRAADAFQLAAAMVAAEGRNDLLPFVSLDARLVEAARREGFPIIP